MAYANPSPCAIDLILSYLLDNIFLYSATANFASLLNHSHQLPYAIAIIYSNSQLNFLLTLFTFPGDYSLFLFTFISKFLEILVDTCCLHLVFSSFAHILVSFSIYHSTTRTPLTSVLLNPMINIQPSSHLTHE